MKLCGETELADAELADIRSRVERATPGPWVGPRVTDDWPPGWVGVYAGEAVAGDAPVPSVEAIPLAVIGVCGRYDEAGVEDNARFIAHAKCDVERLLDEVERLRSEVEKCR